MAKASHFLLIFALFNLLFAGNHGALYNEEGYWNSVFPNAPMPKALKDLLSPADEGNVPFTKWVDDDEDPTKNFVPDYLYVGDSTFLKEFDTRPNSFINPDSEEVPFSKWIDDEQVPTGNNLNSINKDDGNPDETPDRFSKIPATFYEGDSTKESKNHHDDYAALDKYSMINSIYFLQKDLRAGTKANLPFFVKQAMETKKFLPYTVAESMPFSSDKFPEILKHYSVKAGSMEAKAMNVTVRNCARASSYSIGEDKYCATSFKSFIDMGVTKLGKNIKLLACEIEDGTNSPLFTIGNGVRIMGKKEIVCHSMPYPYVVFLCHSIENTVVYRVPLLGIDGGKKLALALAVCHLDTSGWDHNHPSFRILKIEPGTLPVCHFLYPDTVVWVPSEMPKDH
ncbi:hypothetical protein CCACVL1_24583 [Corchorus capsularis]|uniref:BURP domain-containing protein n=1 Tax=Corchorus capsularis TaxID=210143 RepID=A0A1R3GP10_COCAP|nr:hypothetical protein CCACVL1_24583 [Corchorus capsularis]